LAGTLAWTSPAFATTNNIANLFTTASVTTILALGATLVIIAGGIDISVGSLLALSAAVCGLILKLPHAPSFTIPLGITAGLAVGAAGGALNASLSLLGRVHPIVVTLGMMTVYRGILIGLTGGNEIVGLPGEFNNLAHGRLLGVNGAIWSMLLAIVTVQFWLSYTRYGRYQYAVGSSPTAARLAGISQARVWLVSFAGGGLLAALAGIVELAKSGSMQSGLGTGYELQAIAAAVIGGTAVSGGRGSAWGTFLGALLLSLVSNALVLWQVSRYHSGLVIGGLILVAVILDRGGGRLES
jgi:ribose transport system permease protein